MEYEKFIAHGTTIQDVVKQKHGVKNAANYLHRYIVGECARESDRAGDETIAAEYRAVTLGEVEAWVRHEIA